MDDALIRLHKDDGVVFGLLKKHALLNRRSDWPLFVDDCSFLLRSVYKNDFDRCAYAAAATQFLIDSSHFDLRNFSLLRPFLEEHCQICQQSLIISRPPLTNLFNLFLDSYFSHPSHSLVRYRLLLTMSQPSPSIGYYNPSQYPVTFTSTKQNRGPVTIEPRSPVLDVHGKLVPFDDDLERQVRDKLLKHIIPGDPMYKNFAGVNAAADKRAVTPSMPAKSAPVGPSVAQTDRSDNYETEVVDDTTYYVLSGKRFTSLAALKAYQATLS